MPVTQEIGILERYQIKEVVEQAPSLVARAEAFVVDSAERLQEAADFLRTVKSARKKLVNELKEPVSQARRAHLSIVALRQRHDSPLVLAERIVKCKVADYQNEQESLRREEEQRLQAELRKREEEKRLEAAQKLEDAGHKADADAVLEQPIVVPPVVVPAAPKPEGVSGRQIWKHRVVNEALIPHAFLMINDRALAEIARTGRENASVPGVEFYPETVVAVKGY